MNEKLLAHILYAVGTLGLVVPYVLGARWATLGPWGRVGFVLCVVASATAIALDFRQRARETRAARSSQPPPQD